MRADNQLIALLLFMALLLNACNTKTATDPVIVPDGAKAGELTGLKDCEFQPTGSKSKFAAECGTLVVPENWEKPNSRLIALPVVRIPAKGPTVPSRCYS